MKYVNPANVVSPRDCIENVKVLFDGGIDSFSIAEMDWEDSHVYAIRWNVAYREWDDQDKINDVKMCLGMPTSRAYPVWFVLPDTFISTIPKVIQNEEARLKKAEMGNGSEDQ